MNHQEYSELFHGAKVEDDFNSIASEIEKNRANDLTKVLAEAIKNFYGEGPIHPGEVATAALSVNASLSQRIPVLMGLAHLEALGQMAAISSKKMELMARIYQSITPGADMTKITVEDMNAEMLKSRGETSCT